MARFTEHSGDPAWLKSQRDAQTRAMRTPPPQTRTNPAAVAPPPASSKSSAVEFVHGAKHDSQLGAFIMGAVFGAVLRGRR